MFPDFLEAGGGKKKTQLHEPGGTVQQRELTYELKKSVCQTVCFVNELYGKDRTVPFRVINNPSLATCLAATPLEARTPGRGER